MQSKSPGLAEAVTLVGAAPIIRSQQAPHQGLVDFADLSVQDLKNSHHGTGGFRVKSVELPLCPGR